MFNDIIIDLEKLNNKFTQICELLTYEEVVLDNKLYTKLTKEKKLLSPIINKYQEYISSKNIVNEFNKDIKNYNEEYSILINNELENIKILEKELLKLYNELNAHIQNIIIEIICDKQFLNGNFYLDLIKGYIAFCEKNNFLHSENNLKNSTQINITGLNAEDIFSNEKGIHVNNSEEIQVFVYKKLCDNFSYNEKDIIVETCHSSGAGGQHVNTTDSAIKVTHIPTKITAICQNERSQFQNKQNALKNLKLKVEKHYTKLKNDFYANEQKEQINLIKNRYVSKIYNYKENKIIKNNKEIISFSDFLSGKIL